MENPIVICLDFYGLPGSGKSTISHLVAEKLRIKTIVVEPSYHLDHSFKAGGRFIRKCLKTLSLLLRCPRVFFSVNKVIKTCGYNCFCKDFYIHLLNISYKVGVLRNPPKGYVVFDQGLWQSVISLFYRKEDLSLIIYTYDHLRSLANPAIRFVDIYIQVGTGDAIERMDSRNAAISRVQLLSEVERIAELDKLLEIMDGLPSPRIVVDSSHNDVKSCVNYLINNLNTSIKKM